MRSRSTLLSFSPCKFSSSKVSAASCLVEFAVCSGNGIVQQTDVVPVLRLEKGSTAGREKGGEQEERTLPRYIWPTNGYTYAQRSEVPECERKPQGSRLAMHFDH